MTTNDANDPTSATSAPQAYTYTITIDRFATPKVSGILTNAAGATCNINSCLNCKDNVTIVVNAVNFTNVTNFDMRVSTARVLGANRLLKKIGQPHSPTSLFSGGNNFIVNGGGVQQISSGMLTVNNDGWSAWHLTIAFWVQDDNGCYSDFLPDPEPIVGPCGKC